MKDKQFYKIFKSKREAEALPDMSKYTDDILGANMSLPVDNVPEEIRMIQRKRAVAPFMDPINSDEECEEENEEGDLDSNKEPVKLSNKELGFQHGFNPSAPQQAKKWEQFKDISTTSIPRIIKAGIETRSHIEPSFHTVSELDTDFKSPIKALSKQLFNQLTTTPVDDIQVIAHMVGSKSPNSKDELHAVEEWLHHHGTPDNTSIEDLKRKVSNVDIVHTEGITHLLVNNSSGKFIFSWPSIDNHIGE